MEARKAGINYDPSLMESLTRNKGRMFFPVVLSDHRTTTQPELARIKG